MQARERSSRYLEGTPDTFFELQRVVAQLSSKSKDYLLAAIANMAMRAPEGLAALGVTEFAEEDIEWQ
jgi:hypothetical protein